MGLPPLFLGMCYRWSTFFIPVMKEGPAAGLGLLPGRWSLIVPPQLVREDRAFCSLIETTFGFLTRTVARAGTEPPELVTQGRV